MNSSVERENLTVIFLVQVLLGNVSKNLLGVAAEVSESVVRVHFAVAVLDEQMVEDLQDVLFELEAQYHAFPNAQPPIIEQQVHVGPVDQDWPGRGHRMIYFAKVEE
jgi:hypothetical protein